MKIILILIGLLSLSYTTAWYIYNNPSAFKFGWILTIPSCIIFIYLGFLIKNSFDKNTRGLIFLAIYLIWFFIDPILVGMRFNVFIYGLSYPCWYPYSIFGIIGINYIANKFLNNNNIFAVVGKDTMPIYCFHWIILTSLSFLLPEIREFNKVEFLLILLLANSLLLPIISYYIKRLKCLSKYLGYNEVLS